MGSLRLSYQACARILTILALLVLSGWSQAFAYQEGSREATVVASAGTQLTDDVIAGGDLSECVPPAPEQGSYCDHACCNVQASGPAPSFDDDRAALIAQPGAPVPRRIETRLIAFTAHAPIPASSRFLLFRNFRE